MKLIFTRLAILLTACFMLVVATPLRADVLNDLIQLHDAHTHRVSSSAPDWKNNNADHRPIAPGETLTIADIKGPGIIRHIWFTVNAEDPRYGRSLTLRMYWDGEKEPAVEAPLGDFFAEGHGELKNVNSLPVSVSADGRAKNCYWAMPFQKSARITITNDSAHDRVSKMYYMVDYEEVDDLPKDTPYFHAQYRQEYPAKAGQDYLILDAEGRGHYVGTVLSVRDCSESWFGEGDDRFYVDGDAEPTLRGTGTEDYFCEAWGFSDIQRPFYGVVSPGLEQIGDKICVYRWHINDPVRFSKSLKVTIEHKGFVLNAKGKTVSSFLERPDLYSSVAFWYQTGIAKRFTTMPPADQRVLPRRTIDLLAMKSAVKTEPAETTVVIQKLPGGQQQLYAEFNKSDGVFTLPLSLEQPMQGVATLKLTKSFDYGTWQVFIDGKPARAGRRDDLYANEIDSADVEIGYVDLPAGQHELKFQCIGKNADSSGYFLGIRGLEVEELTPYFVKSK